MIAASPYVTPIEGRVEIGVFMLFPAIALLSPSSLHHHGCVCIPELFFLILIRFGKWGLPELIARCWPGMISKITSAN